MKIFGFKVFYKNSTAFKKKLMFVTLAFCLFNLNAQEKNNFKLGIEAGLLRPTDFNNLGLFLNVEPKLKISKNTFFGLRIGATANSHVYENYDNFQFNIDDEAGNGVISIVPNIDYYLKINDINSYLGVGVGYYLLASYIGVSRIVIADPSKDTFDVYPKNKIGILLRAGLESGKLRFGMEYNFVPKADIEIPTGQKIGTVNNSFLGLSFGFTIVGWKGSK